jgi:hypothetical protein
MRNHFLRAGRVANLPSDSGGGGGSIVTTDLTTHWDFGNSSSYSGSGSTVTDLSGNGNHGTLQNTSNISYSSNDGGHIILDPSASSNYPYITRADTIKDIGTGDFTFEFWWNVSYDSSRANDGNTALIRNTPNWGNPWNENLAIFIRDGKLRVSNWLAASATTTAGSWTYIDSSTFYVDGYQSDYEHLVVTRIGTGNNNMKCYRNNSLVETWTNKAEYDDATTNADHRTFGSDASYFFGGKFAIYRLYVGTGLTSSEVTTNWNAQKSRFGH